VRIPVVFAALPTTPLLKGREAVRARRGRQRAALAEACALAGAPHASDLPRDRDGAPAPFGARGEWRWSVANTRGAAAAAVGPCALGVDVEALDRRRVPPASAFADAEELALAPAWDARRALELWCAKEAVLKLALVGIAELRACRLSEPPRRRNGAVALVLEHRGVRRVVTVQAVDGFLVALAADAPAYPAIVRLAGAEAVR
jgi:phosphopantetheinyl transferase